MGQQFTDLLRGVILEEFLQAFLGCEYLSDPFIYAWMLPDYLVKAFEEFERSYFLFFPYDHSQVHHDYVF